MGYAYISYIDSDGIVDYDRYTDSYGISPYYTDTFPHNICYIMEDGYIIGEIISGGFNNSYGFIWLSGHRSYRLRLSGLPVWCRQRLRLRRCGRFLRDIEIYKYISRVYTNLITGGFALRVLYEMMTDGMLLHIA